MTVRPDDFDFEFCDCGARRSRQDIAVVHRDDRVVTKFCPACDPTGARRGRLAAAIGGVLTDLPF